VNFFLVLLHPNCGLKGSDSNFEINIFQILKVARNETTTLH